MTILRLTEEEWAARGGAASGWVVQDRLFDLRDYFAGQAIGRIEVTMSYPDDRKREQAGVAEAARLAYAVADALLKERDKEKA